MYFFCRNNIDLKYTSSSVIQQVEVYLKYTWSILEIYLKYALSMLEVYFKYTWKYTSSVFEVYLKYTSL